MGSCHRCRPSPRHRTGPAVDLALTAALPWLPCFRPSHKQLMECRLPASAHCHQRLVTGWGAVFKNICGKFFPTCCPAWRRGAQGHQGCEVVVKLRQSPSAAFPVQRHVPAPHCVISASLPGWPCSQAMPHQRCSAGERAPNAASTSVSCLHFHPVCLKLQSLLLQYFAENKRHMDGSWKM